MATGSIGRARFPLDASMKIKGATDDTLIGNVGDSLKTTATLNVSPSDTPGVSVLSKKYRIEFDETDVTAGTAFATVFNYTGSGKFFGFILVNDHKEIETKLTIDGTEVIFSLKAEDVGAVQISNPDVPDLVQETGGIMTADNDKTVALKLSFPIVFDTSVKIEVKRTEDTDHKVLRSMVSLTKET